MNILRRTQAALSAVFPLHLNKTVTGLQDALGDAEAELAMQDTLLHFQAEQIASKTVSNASLSRANRDLFGALRMAEEDITEYLKAELKAFPSLAFRADASPLMGTFQVHRFVVSARICERVIDFAYDPSDLPASFFNALADREGIRCGALVSEEIRNQLKKAFNK
jgi:hypothetical protein